MTCLDLKKFLSDLKSALTEEEADTVQKIATLIKQTNNKLVLVNRVINEANKENSLLSYRRGGSILYYAHFIDEAIALFTSGLEIDENDYKLLYNLGTLYGTRGHLDYTLSIKYLTRVINVDKNVFDAHYNLSVAYFNLGQFSTAKNFARNINYYSAKQPVTAEILRIKGENFQFNLNDFDNAIEMYLERLKISPDYGTMTDLSIIYFNKRDKSIVNSSEYFHYNELGRKYAQKAFEAIQIESNEDADVISEQAQLLLLLGKFDESYKVLVESNEFDENHEDHLMLAGEICFKLKKYDQSIRYLREAKNLSKGRFMTLVMLAHVHQEMGENEEAILIIERVLDNSNYNLVSGLLLMIELLKQRGEDLFNSDDEECLDDFEQAFSICQRLLRNPKDQKLSRNLDELDISSLNYSMGWILIKKFEFSKNVNDGEYLSKASRHFGKVSDKSILHKSAMIAQTKIRHNKRKWVREMLLNKRLLISVSLTLLVISICLMIFGKPNLTGLKANVQHLSSIIPSKELKIKFENDYSERVFFSKEMLVADIESFFKANGIDSLLINHHKSSLDKRALSSAYFTPVSDALLIFLFTASIAVLILGILFNHFTKFKMLSIEIERSSINAENIMEQFKIERGG